MNSLDVYSLLIEWIRLTSFPIYESKDSFCEDIIKRVIYEDKNILVINKPSEISMHGLKNGLANVEMNPTECCFSLSDIKKELSHYSNTEQLYECYSQNRLYSGLVLYSKNSEARETLKKYFRHVRINKIDHQKYWILCMNNANLETISKQEIFFKRHSLQNSILVYLGFLVKSPAKKHRKSGEVLTSQFKHRVMNSFCLNESEHLSLLELNPILTKWDALSLMLEKLSCSALGDHKYATRWTRVLDTLVLSDRQLPPSDTNELSSQSLTDCLRKRLNIKKKQLLPLHIHSRQLIIPRLNSKKKTIKLMAPLPEFYKHTLQCLKNDK